MIIKKFVLGSLDTNCYLLIQDDNCLIVDPAYDFELIKKKIENLNLLGILVTHYHFDHIGALKELKDYFKVPIYDYNSPECIKGNIFNFKIIHNPGHTDDSVSFYFEKHKVMFVGDFIFQNSIGRTDLETGNMDKMQMSLDNIKKYDNDIILYPGHGEQTSLEAEKRNNIFLK